MFCLAKENEENGEQEADNEVDEEEEEGGEEEDEEEEGDGNFLCSPHPYPMAVSCPGQQTPEKQRRAESSISPSRLRPGGSRQPGSVLPRSPGPPVLGVKSALNPFQQVEDRFLPSSLLRPDGTIPWR